MLNVFLCFLYNIRRVSSLCLLVHLSPSVQPTSPVLLLSLMIPKQKKQKKKKKWAKRGQGDPSTPPAAPCRAVLRHYDLISESSQIAPEMVATRMLTACPALPWPALPWPAERISHQAWIWVWGSCISLGLCGPGLITGVKMKLLCPSPPVLSPLFILSNKETATT